MQTEKKCARETSNDKFRTLKQVRQKNAETPTAIKVVFESALRRHAGSSTAIGYPIF